MTFRCVHGISHDCDKCSLEKWKLRIEKHLDEIIKMIVKAECSLEKEIDPEVEMRKDLAGYCMETLVNAINKIGVENHQLKERIDKLENIDKKPYKCPICGGSGNHGNTYAIPCGCCFGKGII